MSDRAITVNVYGDGCAPGVNLSDLLNSLTAKVDQIMAKQADIDAIATRIETAVANIRADIQAIKDAHPALDLSKLEASVGMLDGLDGENPPAPVE